MEYLAFDLEKIQEDNERLTEMHKSTSEERDDLLLRLERLRHENQALEKEVARLKMDQQIESVRSIPVKDLTAIVHENTADDSLQMVYVQARQVEENINLIDFLQKERDFLGKERDDLVEDCESLQERVQFLEEELSNFGVENQLVSSTTQFLIVPEPLQIVEAGTASENEAGTASEDELYEYGEERANPRQGEEGNGSQEEDGENNLRLSQLEVDQDYSSGDGSMEQEGGNGNQEESLGASQP